MNILVTGASGNLGKATVEKFLAEGHTVIATVTPGKGLGYPTTGSIYTYEVNLADEAVANRAVAAIIAEHKTIDAAVLTVGGFAMGGIATTDGAALQKMMTLNFNTAYFVARPVFLQMMGQQKGRIILIGSRPGLMAKEGKGVLAYALSKSLIFKLTDLLNTEGNAKNVAVSVIVPGTIDTPENRKSMPTANFSEWQKPESIADTIGKLIADNSAALTQPIVKLFD